jgi:hypothetical protein
VTEKFVNCRRGRLKKELQVEVRGNEVVEASPKIGVLLVD